MDCTIQKTIIFLKKLSVDLLLILTLRSYPCKIVQIFQLINKIRAFFQQICTNILKVIEYI